MGRDLGDRRLGDEADMRRHPLLGAHRCRASEIEMDLLLSEQERRAPLAHALGPHAEHPLVELDTAADIGDRDVEMVDALDLHGWPRGMSDTTRVPRLPLPDQQRTQAIGMRRVANSASLTIPSSAWTMTQALRFAGLSSAGAPHMERL